MPESEPSWFISTDKWTGESCVICSFKLTDKFPEDFPDEFKFCCTCKAIAFRMVINDLPLPLEYWIKNRRKKIMKIITLMG